MTEIEKHIEILNSRELDKTEKDLLDINIELMNQEDRFNVGLKQIGEEGIKSLLQMVNYKAFIMKFARKNCVEINGCLTNNRFI